MEALLKVVQQTNYESEVLGKDGVEPERTTQSSQYTSFSDKQST